MKKFLRGILTILIIMGLMVLGISFSINNFVVDTTKVMVKKTVADGINEVIKDYEEDIPKEVLTEVTAVIQDSKELEEMIDTVLEKGIDLLLFKDNNEKIDVAGELDTLINESEKILNNHGITVTKEQKEELKSLVSNEELNDTFNTAINEAREEMPDDVKNVINVYSTITSTSFKIVLISIIVVLLILIAMLHKSLYKWLGNLAVGTLVTGICYAIMPLGIDVISKELASEGVVLSGSAFANFGYVMIGIGILSIIIKIILGNILNKNDSKC